MNGAGSTKGCKLGIERRRYCSIWGFLPAGNMNDRGRATETKSYSYSLKDEKRGGPARVVACTASPGDG